MKHSKIIPDPKHHRILSLQTPLYLDQQQKSARAKQQLAELSISYFQPQNQITNKQSVKIQAWNKQNPNIVEIKSKTSWIKAHKIDKKIDQHVILKRPKTSSLHNKLVELEPKQKSSFLNIRAISNLKTIAPKQFYRFQKVKQQKCDRSMIDSDIKKQEEYTKNYSIVDIKIGKYPFKKNIFYRANSFSKLARQKVHKGLNLTRLKTETEYTTSSTTPYNQQVLNEINLLRIQKQKKLSQYIQQINKLISEQQIRVEHPLQVKGNNNSNKKKIEQKKR